MFNEKIAELNVQRFSEWSVPFTLASAKQAVFAFKGDVYTGIAIETSNQEQLDYIQSSVLILSGLYGILRPLDLMMPYRLEMGTKLQIGKDKNLYHFWKETLTNHLIEELKEDTFLVNLASDEYFKVIDKKRIPADIITPIFKDIKNGIIKIGSSPIPPAIIDNKLVIGTFRPSIEAYDVEDGKLYWKYYLRTFDKNVFGEKDFIGGNPWGGISADIKKGVVFITTGNPKPNFVGTLRPGKNLFANNPDLSMFSD